MSNPQGWVKVHRKILENPLFKNPKLFTLWVYLLLRANHSDSKTMAGNKVIELKRGQFLTGRKVLSNALDIPETTLERLLNVLESEHQIGQQKLSKYRLISITNYELYQGSEQQTDNKRTTNGQQTDTDKNVKKEKNVNNKDLFNECLKYFNDKTGKKFKTAKGLSTRLNDYSVDEVKSVIDSKTIEWLGTEMEKYLRPETIFGPKFEGYLNNILSGIDGKPKPKDGGASGPDWKKGLSPEQINQMQGNQ